MESTLQDSRPIGGVTSSHPLPKLFAAMMNEHLAARPNVRTVAAGGPPIPWLFPSQNPGHHLAPQRVMSRLRQLGINVRASKNTALQSMVAEVPAPLVAQMLGYSHPTTQLHAALAATTWARYAASNTAHLDGTVAGRVTPQTPSAPPRGRSLSSSERVLRGSVQASLPLLSAPVRAHRPPSLSMITSMRPSARLTARAATVPVPHRCRCEQLIAELLGLVRGVLPACRSPIPQS